MAEQNTLTSLKIDTNMLPEKQQYAFFREQLFDSAGIEVDRDGPSDNPFSFIAEYNRTAALTLYRYQSITPCFLRRSEQGMARAEMNAFGVHYRYSGNDLATHYSDGKGLTRSGDLRSLDTERPFFYQHEGVVVYTLNLHRPKLQSEVPGLSNLHNMILRSSPVTRILKTAIRDVFSELRNADDSEVGTLSDMLHKLAVDAIRHQWIQELESLEIRSETVLCTIVDYIHQNFHNRDLSPEMISKELGISRSKLYQVCQQVDTPQRLIRLIRLEKASGFFRTAADCNVGDVAYRTGFSSRPALSRAFIDHYGVSPSEYREGLRVRTPRQDPRESSPESVWETLRASLKAAALG
ncbi:helix-turn-helix transcriptional regulator [Ruegeria sp. EL01]|jgi:AraC-like DNA-binding protein|uniref:helix-turn-helix transcriptional regulator n=1 Tax=Ruegeria sp. EL01 TaxID=2107578 RepID=UPI0013C41AA2|nr:helix-turn-helix transcriptional regulator [Ruegeria sp. EL01]